MKTPQILTADDAALLYVDHLIHELIDYQIPRYTIRRLRELPSEFVPSSIRIATNYRAAEAALINLCGSPVFREKSTVQGVFHVVHQNGNCGFQKYEVSIVAKGRFLARRATIRIKPVRDQRPPDAGVRAGLNPPPPLKVLKEERKHPDLFVSCERKLITNHTNSTPDSACLTTLFELILFSY